VQGNRTQLAWLALISIAIAVFWPWWWCCRAQSWLSHWVLSLWGQEWALGLCLAPSLSRGLCGWNGLGGGGGCDFLISAQCQETHLCWALMLRSCICLWSLSVSRLPCSWVSPIVWHCLSPEPQVACAPTCAVMEAVNPPSFLWDLLEPRSGHPSWAPFISTGPLKSPEEAQEPMFLYKHILKLQTAGPNVPWGRGNRNTYSPSIFGLYRFCSCLIIERKLRHISI
jgi:hypothetical protein